MNIAHLLPTSAVFPLKKHNGRYEWALRLARLQAAAGHHVTIYAGEGSSDDSAITWRSTASPSTDKKERNLALWESALNDTEHDVFHSHFDSLHFLIADRTTRPIVVTQHWYPSKAIADAAKSSHKGNVATVPVTDLMKEEDKRLGIPASERIYHGIDLAVFQPSYDADERFMCVGRIHPMKGTGEAVRYAKETGIQLDIIGKLNETEQSYWESFAGDIDGETIRYLGSIPQEELVQKMAHAKALIFPSQAAEAFGQVTIEAQACGTPVIISSVGASEELVLDGETGFVCKNDADFTQAISNIDSIDRHACRHHAEQFDIKDMVAAYEALYMQLINR